MGSCATVYYFEENKYFVDVTKYAQWISVAGEILIGVSGSVHYNMPENGEVNTHLVPSPHFCPEAVNAAAYVDFGAKTIRGSCCGLQGVAQKGLVTDSFC